MNSVKDNEFFIPEEYHGMHSCLSILNVIEAISIDFNEKKRLSKRTPRCSEAFMRIKTKELDVAYRSYYSELKALEELPINEQLPEILQLFQSISSQYDPPMFSEDVWYLADELSSPDLIDESNETPPFTSIIFQEPDRNLVMTQAKMLYLYREIRDQLRYKLQYLIEKKEQKILNQMKIKEKQEKNTTWKGPDKKTMELRNLGKNLEEWYEDYCEKIVHYPTDRQLNALRNMRKQVLSSVDWVEGSPRMGDSPEDINYLIFSSPNMDYLPRLKDFGCNFGKYAKGEQKNMAWEDYIPENYGHNMTLAEFAYIFFCSALNYEIERLEGVKSYDKPFDDVISDVKNSKPTKQIRTLDDNEEKQLPSFGFASDTQALWATIYERLIKTRWIKKSEVSQNDFIYIMCGVGKVRLLPIHWYGPTNALADIVRRKLLDSTANRWKVAESIFVDKNNKPLPKSFQTTKTPGEKTTNKVDNIFK